MSRTPYSFSVKRRRRRSRSPRTARRSRRTRSSIAPSRPSIRSNESSRDDQRDARLRAVHSPARPVSTEGTHTLCATAKRFVRPYLAAGHRDVHHRPHPAGRHDRLACRQHDDRRRSHRSSRHATGGDIASAPVNGVLCIRRRRRILHRPDVPLELGRTSIVAPPPIAPATVGTAASASTAIPTSWRSSSRRPPTRRSPIATDRSRRTTPYAARRSSSRSTASMFRSTQRHVHQTRFALDRRNEHDHGERAVARGRTTTAPSIIVFADFTPPVAESAGERGAAFVEQRALRDVAAITLEVSDVAPRIDADARRQPGDGPGYGPGRRWPRRQRHRRPTRPATGRASIARSRSAGASSSGGCALSGFDPAE